ncbi:ABC transporter ATP-binding protein [Tropicimonas sp. S265A]|uniref:ABC transporter ATP-binding protein n=1 Tax=Tropicimonas sp. S265A TaxID=3415134 RepID=UPI003C7CC610
MTALISLSDVHAGYGTSTVLEGVSFALAEGETLALMGRNGMGKTTTVRVLCGLLPASGGVVQVGGTPIAGMAAHAVARLGLGLVPEGRRCFANLTVAENLTAAARPGPWDMARVAGLFPRLSERRDQLAASLSGGEQQMLAIGRALMTNPRALILDEATEGLAPVVRGEIWAAIAAVKAETGLAIIVIDKSLTELRRIADRAVILDRGRSVWTGSLHHLEPQEAARLLGV